MQLDDSEFSQYAHFDNARGYTRNLIGTDYQSYTLLLLCWTPGQSSPIHDHPCDGCWMKVLKGQINECRYSENASTKTSNCSVSSLTCILDTTACEGDVIYIEDSMGLHKVGNPSLTVPAITLHLYCPPIQCCKVWCAEELMFPKQVAIRNFSEYGQKL
jgi:cysteine dioxygenase